jgi:hypothetical protein
MARGKNNGISNWRLVIGNYQLLITNTGVKL